MSISYTKGNITISIIEMPSHFEVFGKAAGKT
jgi:hypothetical protein